MAADLAAVWLGAVALNLLYVSLISERAELGRRLQFIALMWLQNLISVVCRFAIMQWGVTHTLLYWTLFLPLSVYETTALQIMADLFEGRPLKPPTWRQVNQQSKVCVIEAIGYSISCSIWPWLIESATIWPTAGTLVHSVWRAAVFDVGLDLGFYAFHRTCHVNRTLYRWVHAPHHTDTGKEHGHLVAYETYELSIVETLSILSSYLVGFELLTLFYPFTMCATAVPTCECSIPGRCAVMPKESRRPRRPPPLNFRHSPLPLRRCAVPIPVICQSLIEAIDAADLQPAHPLPPYHHAPTTDLTTQACN
jgi:hypothetical protein